jgi:hypothetical protein
MINYQEHLDGKVIRDGKVAVLYSPGYGAGWYSWNIYGRPKKWMLFHPLIVDAVEKGDRKLAEKIANKIDPNGSYSGAEDLEIEWIEQGHSFKIEEYDGYERITDYGFSEYIEA